MRTAVGGALAAIQAGQGVEGAGMLAAAADEQSLREALLDAGDDADEVICDVAMALKDGDVRTQSLWRAVITAARHVDDDVRGDVVEQLATCLGEARSQDLVLWSDLLNAASTVLAAKNALNHVATALVEAGVTSEVPWLDLVQAALRIEMRSDVERDDSVESGDEAESEDHDRVELLKDIVDHLKEAKKANIAIPAAWPALVEAIGQVGAPSRIELGAAIATGMGKAGIQDPPLWTALIARGEDAGEYDGKYEAETGSQPFILTLSAAMRTAKAVSGAPWQALLKVAVTNVEVDDLGLVLKEIATDMGKAGVGGEATWAVLLDATGRTGAMAATDRWAILKAAAQRPACTGASAWNLVVDCVQASADDERPALLDMLVKELSVARHMARDTWRRLLAPPPGEEVLGLIARVLDVEARKAHGAATARGTIPATSAEARANAVAARDAAYAVYEMFQPLLCRSFLDTDSPHPDFRALGQGAALSLIAGLHWTKAYKEIHQAVLRNAAGKGSLALDRIPSVAMLREKIRHSAPAVKWDVLAARPSSVNKTQGRFCEFPELEQAVGNWTRSLGELLHAVVDCVRDAPQGAGRRARQAAVSKAFKAAVQIVDVSGVTANISMNRFDLLLAPIFGPDGRRDIEIDERLLNALLERKSGSVGFKRNVEDAMGKLATSLEGLGGVTKALEKKAKAWHESWRQLDQLVKRDDFAERYQDRAFYTIAPIDKDAVSSLVLGDEVACCLSPGGTEFEAWVEREASPAFVPVAVRKGNVPVAVAWCAICTIGDPAELAWVVDFCDIKPSYTQDGVGNDAGATLSAQGRQVMEELVAFMPALSSAAGIHQAWLGQQRYGRMEKSPVVTARTYEAKAFKIVGAAHMARPPYTDNIALPSGAGRFSRLHGAGNVADPATNNRGS